MNGHRALRAVVADALRIPAADLWPTHVPLGDTPADEVALFAVVMALQAVNPHFDVPEQLDVRDASLDDLFHLCAVMGEGHHREDDDL